MGRKIPTADMVVDLTCWQRVVMFWTICMAGFAMVAFKITRQKVFAQDALRLVGRMDRLHLLDWKGQIWLMAQRKQYDMEEGGE